MYSHRKSIYSQATLKILNILSKVFLTLAIIMIIIAGVSFFIAWNGSSDVEKIIKDGEVTTAQIVEHSSSPYMKTTINGVTKRYYKAEVSYMVDFEEYTCSDVNVTEADIADGYVDVYYLPNKPENAVTDIGTVQLVPIIIGSVASGVGFIFLIVGIVFLFSVKRKKKYILNLPNSFVNGNQQYQQNNQPVQGGYPQYTENPQNPASPWEK